jgi:putative ABC transport system ATP-binding protein
MRGGADVTAVVEAIGLGKVHGRGDAAVTALEDVDLAVAHGEFVAVTGPSGCGKSTLLNLIGGLDAPTSGEVRLSGERIDRAGEARRARLRRTEIGFVFQFFNLILNLTVRDNVELPALLAGVPSREARRRTGELLERLGLAEAGERVPGDLSGGQQQRVAIARALVNRPSLLLADEPTGNLDSNAAREVMSVLRERHREGQTIVLVTHDLRIASTADRVVSMRDGRIAAETLLGEAAGVEDPLARLVALGG